MTKSDPGYVQAVIDQKTYELTFIQQDFVRKNVDKYSLVELMQKTYKEPSLNERSIEYDYIRKFAAKIKRGAPRISFSEAQIEFIEKNGSSMSALEIARNIFPKADVKALSSETQTVAAYLKAVGLSDSDSNSPDEYKPPRAASSIVRKINLADTNADWDANALAPFEKKCVEALKGYLQSARFSYFMNICDAEMKSLFEQEFIKATYDKHDLNTEELNMYITLCTEYVNIHQQQKNKMILEQKINQIISSDDDDDAKKLYMTWVELLDKREQDLSRSKKSAESLQSKLSDTRVNRMKTQADVNDSLSKFVEEMKSQEGRARLLRIAEAQALLVEKEMERIETAEEYIANIQGISQDEIRRF